MLEAFQGVLGLASAALVGLIAAGFGAMFVFFSGASALVLGQFVPFSRAPRVGLVAVGFAIGLTAALAFGLDLEPRWALPVAQAAAGLVGFGLARLRPRLGMLLAGLGVWLLAAGALEVAQVAAGVSFTWAPLESLPSWMLLSVVLAAWPLVVGGLAGHFRERPVEWFISLRYLVAKRRQTFISVITVICVMGVALGVAVITVVLSVMNGFARVWEDKILGTRAHAIVYSRVGPFPDYENVRRAVLRADGVVGATPFLEAEAIVRGDDGELQAVLFKGIDPKTVGDATQLRNDLLPGGSIDDLDPDPGAVGDAKLPGIVLGAELAARFFVNVGDTIILISPLGGPSTPLGPAPRMSKFRVAGIFQANFFQFDEGFAYTSLAGAQSFLKLDDVVNGIEIRTSDPYRSLEIGRRVQEEIDRGLGSIFFVRDWKSFYPGFFSALKTERAMMFVLLSFIMVVAGFIIIATLIMMIMEKSRDIAILKTMGCDDDGVLRIFAIEGFLIGVGGLLLGLGMGLVLTWNLDLIQVLVERLMGVDVLPPNVYQLEQLPYQVVPLHLTLISTIAMVLSIGATLLPSWQAARLDPAEALRYE